MTETNNNKKPITSNIFIPLYLLIFTVIIAIVGWFNMAIGDQNNQIDRNRNDISDVKGDIKSINTNVANINQAINEIKNELKRK